MPLKSPRNYGPLATYICQCGCGEEFKAPYRANRKYKNHQHSTRASVRAFQRRQRLGLPDKRRNPTRSQKYPIKSLALQGGQYPIYWGLVARIIKAAASWTCEHCGKQFDPTGKAIESIDGRGRPIVLTVHHLDGNKSNCEYENLLACCPTCHLFIQANWAPGKPLPEEWNEAPQWMLRRGLKYSSK